jgi:hypothetical protein
MFGMVLRAACLALPLADSAAEGKKPTRQQETMADCGKRASQENPRGDERRAFMSGCLGAKNSPRRA